MHTQVPVALAGGGIGLLPNFLAATVDGLTRLLPQEVDVPLVFTAVLAPRALRGPAVTEVIQQLRGEVSRRRHELDPVV